VPDKSQSFPRQLQEQLIKIERRDWELWILALLMVVILMVGYLLVIVPAVFMGQRVFFFQANMSSQLLIGQMVLVLLFLAYLAHKHIQVRNLRSQSITEALNYQVAHTQLLLDPLTQAFNRAGLEEIISKEMKRVRRKQATMVFLYIDVNDLKKVNTRFGHLSGDLVLTDVGAILKNCARGSDYVIRMGGDEFLVALVDTDEPGAEVVKRRIVEHANSWNQESRLPGFNLGLSIGVQVFDGTRSFDEVLAEADAKMYNEKTSRHAES
jgi:diguanylate cyclase (GGDEF)-like protein